MATHARARGRRERTATGIGAWLPPEGIAGQLRLEFRLHVRQGGLTVTVLDADPRVPLLPCVALTWQALSYAGPRRAPAARPLRERNPRHPAVDVRGEDVADLLPLLEGRRVLLEPALMQLASRRNRSGRASISSCRQRHHPREVELRARGDNRRFSLLQGGWFEGWPGWHIDTRRALRAASTGASRPPRSGGCFGLRPSPSRSRAQPAHRAGPAEGRARDRRRAAGSRQVADVVDLVPTFRMRAGGSLSRRGSLCTRPTTTRRSTFAPTGCRCR